MHLSTKPFAFVLVSLYLLVKKSLIAALSAPLGANSMTSKERTSVQSSDMAQLFPMSGNIGKGRAEPAVLQYDALGFGRASSRCAPTRLRTVI